jgi:hypothetical protein
MYSYTAWLKYDNGEKANITIHASDIIQARQIVLEIEKCPERSIEFLGRTLSKRDIKQAKGWGF